MAGDVEVQLAINILRAQPSTGSIIGESLVELRQFRNIEGLIGGNLEF